MNTMIDRIRIKELEESLANSTPLLAVVGAGDFAVEKLRAARDEISHRTATFDSKSFRDQAQASFSARAESLQSDMKAAPDQLKALPEHAQEWPAKAQSLFADVVSTAFSTYGDFAGRGKTIVTQARGEQSTSHPKPVTRPASKTTTKKTTKTTKRPSATKSAPKSATTKTTTTHTTATKSAHTES